MIAVVLGARFLENADKVLAGLFRMAVAVTVISIGLLSSLVGAAAAWGSDADRSRPSSREVVDARVDELIRQGLALREANRDAEALVVFQRAHELQRSARTYAQIGFAEQQLKRWTEAEDHLVAALACPETTWLREHRYLVQEQLDKVRRKVASLVIIGTTGATVSVNGEVVGRLPLTRAVRVVAGGVVVKAVSGGFENFDKELEVQGGEVKSLEIALLPLTPKLASAATLPGDQVQRSDGAESGAKELPSEGFWTERRIGAGVATAGLLAGGVAAILLLRRPDDCNPPPGALCNRTPVRSSASRNAGVAVGAVGFVALVSGVVLWATAETATDASQSRVSMSIVPNGVVVAFGGGF